MDEAVAEVMRPRSAPGALPARRLAPAEEVPAQAGKCAAGSRREFLLRLLLACALTTGCERSTSQSPPSADPAVGARTDDPTETALRALETEERALRASTDWRNFPASDRRLGADPIDLFPLDGEHFLGVLHGRDRVVVLTRDGQELARLPAPRAPRVVQKTGDAVLVVGDAPAPGVQAFAQYRWQANSLVISDNDVAESRRPFQRFDASRGGEASWSAELDVLAHEVRVRQGEELRATISSDGPGLGVAVREVADGALVAVGMVEDHPLDRTIGSFGYIDSFVRVFAVSPTGRVKPVLEENLSAHGVVTPRGLVFVDDDTLLVAGSGSDKAARLHLSTRAVEVSPSLPGIVALVPVGQGFVGASPLLDAWVVADEHEVRAVPVHNEETRQESRSAESRLGEALVFTTLMAPAQRSEGAFSRFTCEACHFEGGVDGRTHHTGRGDVRATTRPLRGLFNNTPLFTRALDPNITRMAHAEFVVANANTNLDPWFRLSPSSVPWLALLGIQGEQEPAALRRALLLFLRDFTARTNPRALGRSSFTVEEARGAVLFQRHCVECHAARLVGEDPTTEQPFSTWESLVLRDNGPLVWSSPQRRKTGVEPYVHPEGARSSSLRRLEEKRPYFTNGSARTLDEVLDAFVPPDRHAGGDGPHLRSEERAALRAFLVLL